MKSTTINWRQEYRDLWQEWKAVNKIAGKHYRDKIAVLKIMHTLASTNPHTKKYVREFNRAVKILNG